MMGKQRREGRLKLDGSIHDFHWRYPSGNENTYPPYQPAPTWVDDFPNFLFGGRCDCSLEDILCWFFWTGIFSNVCLGKQMCVNKCLILYQGQQRGTCERRGFFATFAHAWCEFEIANLCKASSLSVSPRFDQLDLTLFFLNILLLIIMTLKRLDFDWTFLVASQNQVRCASVTPVPAGFSVMPGRSPARDPQEKKDLSLWTLSYSIHGTKGIFTYI